MQVISLDAGLKLECYTVLRQSCVKTGGLCLFVVMFLPVANARSGTNEQNMAWLPCYSKLDFFVSTKKTKIKTKPKIITRINNEDMTKNKTKKKSHTHKTKQTQAYNTCNRNRDESYNYRQKIICRQSEIQLNCFQLKSLRARRKNSFHFVTSRCAKLSCKTANAISNQ